MNEHEIEQQLQQVAEHRGRGTELVSLYVPPDSNVNSLVQRLSQEYAEAENIKSKQTRKNVRKAVKRTKDILQEYRANLPENGVAIFVGVIDGDLKTYQFDDLPFAVPESKYKCSNEFEVDVLLENFTPDTSYGLLVIERGGAAVGELVGNKINVLNETESRVMGKQRQGGQSAQRFARLREEQKENFFQDMADSVNEYFVEEDTPTVDGLIVGGTTGIPEEFIKQDDLHHMLQDRVLGGGGLSVENGDAQGLKQLSNKAQDLITESEHKEQRELVEHFFQALATEETPVTYTYDDVREAVEVYQAVDKLLISQKANSSPETDLTAEQIRQLARNAEESGAEVYYISDKFEKGNQLLNSFGGVAAFLRYPIN